MAVIGRKNAGYITAAQGAGARYFDIGQLWDELGPTAAWKQYNVPFLKGIVQDKIPVAIVGKAESDSVLRKEVDWLLGHGYEYARDKRPLIPTSDLPSGEDPGVHEWPI